MVILFYGRKSDSVHVSWLLDLFPDMYQHISNLTISYMVLVGIGYFWLLMGVPFRYILLLGIFVIIFNFAYELWLPFLNTNDISDAYYGLWGTILGLLFLYVTHKIGLYANLKHSTNPSISE